MESDEQMLEDKPVTALLRAFSEHGISYGKIAEKAIDPVTGEQLDRRYLADIGRGRLVSSPPPARLRALAAGIGISEEEIKRLAAAQWLEYQLHVEHPSDELWLLWTKVQQLDDGDREAVRILVEGLLEHRLGPQKRLPKHDPGSQE